MLWAALLHDIKKLGPPVFEGKDHIHPFKGAMQSLKVFQRLDIISKDVKEITDEVINMVGSSYQHIYEEGKEPKN